MSYALLIVDDHLVVRLGIRKILAGSNYQVVDEAASGEEALKKVAERRPDIVLLDVRLPSGDGLHVLGRLKLDYPDLPIVMYSSYDNPTYVARAVALGASGYVMKNEPRNVLLETLDSAIQGQPAWSREELRRVTGALATPRIVSDVEVPLTQRESDVLRHMANGLTNKEIALALGISYETVKEHVQHILRKIGVTDRTQAAVWAVRKGLI
ncbi:MAG: DNA-binding response regulator [Pirellulaceae bacterium]|nr:MAG: DNA-binding response regulator [Pirellulaceae bacterium]